MEESKSVPKEIDDFELRYKITGEQFIKIFGYVNLTFSLITNSLKDNNWVILPLSILQEPTMAYEIAVIKRDLSEIQDSLALVTFVFINKNLVHSKIFKRQTSIGKLFEYH